jgi:transposase InsO family protein
VREEVRQAIKKCQICARKASNRSRGPLTPILVNNLFERVQVDLIDFRDTPDDQYKWVLHAKDHFSKYCQLYPLLDKQVVTVARAMAGWIGAFGAPKIVQSDNGREFKGVMRELLLRYGVRIINGRPRTPRT